MPRSSSASTAATTTIYAGTGDDTLIGGSNGTNIFYGNQTAGATTDDTMMGDGLGNDGT